MAHIRDLEEKKNDKNRFISYGLHTNNATYIYYFSLLLGLKLSRTYDYGTLN